MIYNSDQTCPKSNTPCNNFPQVEREWDMSRLLEDLNHAKTECLSSQVTSAEIKKLTPTEICWLHLLLFGLNFSEIAGKLSRTSPRSELSRTLYKYIETLTGKKIKNWVQVRLYLENQGYRIERPSDDINTSRLIRLTMRLEGKLLEPVDLLDIITQNIRRGSLQLKSYYYEESE